MLLLLPSPAGKADPRYGWDTNPYFVPGRGLVLRGINLSCQLDLLNPRLMKLLITTINYTDIFLLGMVMRFSMSAINGSPYMA